MVSLTTYTQPLSLLRVCAPTLASPPPSHGTLQQQHHHHTDRVPGWPHCIVFRTVLKAVSWQGTSGLWAETDVNQAEEGGYESVQQQY